MKRRDPDELRGDREEFDRAVRELGRALRRAVEPWLERCVRTLNDWLTRRGRR